MCRHPPLVYLGSSVAAVAPATLPPAAQAEGYVEQVVDESSPMKTASRERHLILADGKLRKAAAIPKSEPGECGSGSRRARQPPRLRRAAHRPPPARRAREAGAGMVAV